MYQLVGRKFNIRSQKELPIVLFKELKIKGNINFLTTKTKVFSTGKAHIEWLIANESHPFLKILKNYRAYDKIKSTFVDGLRAVKDENNILHTNFLVWGTVSGRPSSKNPNLLNIPKDKLFSDKELMSVRRIFTARKGHQMIVVDFSQIELKLVALLAYVKLLLRGLKKGEDFHTLTARDMYGNIFKRAETIVLKGVWKGKKFLKKVRERYRQRMETMRSKSKTFNFAMIFQAGDERLAQELDTTEEEAADFKEHFFETYPEIQELFRMVRTQVLFEHRVQLPNGRVRRFPKTNNIKDQSKQVRQGFNFLPQGSAGYVARGALVRIWERFHKEKINGSLTNTVYDSIMAEIKCKDVNNAQKIIIEEILRPVPWLSNFVFTAKIGVGADWADAEKNSYKVSKKSDFIPWVSPIHRSGTK